MMTTDERAQALLQMQRTADAFYRSAVAVGNHPFIEFAGLMNEYIQACRCAHVCAPTNKLASVPTFS
jgi:hypothetical protein